MNYGCVCCVCVCIVRLALCDVVFSSLRFPSLLFCFISPPDALCALIVQILLFLATANRFLEKTIATKPLTATCVAVEYKFSTVNTYILSGNVNTRRRSERAHTAQRHRAQRTHTCVHSHDYDYNNDSECLKLANVHAAAATMTTAVVSVNFNIIVNCERYNEFSRFQAHILPAVKHTSPSSWWWSLLPSSN